jgi:hypothetical protein
VTRQPIRRAASAVLAVALLITACSADEPEPEPEPQTVAEEVEEPEPDPDPEPEPEPEPDPEPEDTRPSSPLTGERLEPELLDEPLVMVKIENSPQSRPQSGLDAADVVYEEVVEAGVTRFFVVFHSDIPNAVGPVRSARPVDAQIMAAYGRSGFGYSGARPEVVNLLRQTGALPITEGGAGFFREGSRRAPHNLYLDASALQASTVERDADPLSEVPIGWRFDEDPPAQALSCPTGDDAIASCDDPGATIRIRMSNNYVTTWDYDAEEARYRRSQNGVPFTVTGEGRIGAANVVVLETRHYLGEPNCYGARCPETDVVTDGRPAVILRDGLRFDATWRKTSPSAPLELFTPDGDPFPLAAGPTWIHLPSQLPGLES